jgi:hypothetical protein
MSAIKTARKMADEMRNQRDFLQRDYTAFQGKPFEHFFCPMLLKDEDTDLCMGHVVNDKIPNSSGICVVQRQDVDGFFGSKFESDFVTFLEAKHAKLKDAVFQQQLNKKMKPRIFVDGMECPHYLYQGTTLPRSHTGIHLENLDGEAINLVLKKRPADFLADRAKSWQIVIERDSRITAFVSLIKAAYLTLFRLLGYRYALSGAGLEVGHTILGNFFSEHGHKKVDDVRSVAKQWFRPFVNMMRPIDGFIGKAPQGTIEDGAAMACFGSSGKAFGLVVCVRTNDISQAVLMPVFDNPESAATYFDFLKNDNETLAVSHCEFNAKDRCWHGSDEAIMATWPKKDASFDFE